MGSYYANQYAFLVKLKLAITVILMISVLQGEPDDDDGDYAFSTSNVNNWHTRDIHHYLVFENIGRRTKLHGNCIPMNFDANEFAEISGVRVQLRPKLWDARLVVEIANAIKTVEQKYVWHASRSFEGGVSARVCRKLFDSLAYFRRSFLGRADKGAHVVDLAIAFEYLLTDGFAKGVKQRLVRRFKLAVSDPSLQATLCEELVHLYDARSEVVHKGRLDTNVDVPAVRVAYVHAFLGVVRRLSLLPHTSGTPMGDMLGDIREGQFDCSEPE